jgi:gamma-glutamylputrescine oxidase
MGLNLLHSNDRKGQYPNSWYAATATPLARFSALSGDARADVVIIGGGFTGLSAALHLAEAGMKVTLLEAHRVGFGASGRNGGQLGSGQRMDQEGLEGFVGKQEAQKLWRLGEEAKDLVKSLIAKHDIQCHLRPGVAWTASNSRDSMHLHDYGRHLEDRYGYDQIELLSPEACHQMCPSPDYKGGILDHGAGHLHPLNLALGLARAAAAAGASLHEESEVLDIGK